VLGTAAQFSVATPHIIIGDVRLEHAFTPVRFNLSFGEIWANKTRPVPIGSLPPEKAT